MRVFIPWLLFWAATATAEPTEAVRGLWASEGSIIEISESAGALHARVVAIEDAVYR
jgi:hypothetical protein